VGNWYQLGESSVISSVGCWEIRSCSIFRAEFGFGIVFLMLEVFVLVSEFFVLIGFEPLKADGWVWTLFLGAGFLVEFFL
jgi:hypothetical protein